VLELGQGTSPDDWRQVSRVEGRPVSAGLLGEIPFSAITSRGTWTIRLVARDRDGRRRESRADLTVE
jgi:hypothetical protein